MSIHRLFIVQIFFIVCGYSNLSLAGSKSKKVASADLQKFACQNLFPRIPSQEEIATNASESPAAYHILPPQERPKDRAWKSLSLRLRRQLAYQEFAPNKSKSESEYLDEEASLQLMHERAKYLFFRWASYLENQEPPLVLNGTHQEFWVKYFNQHSYPELRNESDSDEFQEYTYHIFSEEQKELLLTLNKLMRQKFQFQSRDIDGFTALAVSSLMRLGAGLKQPEDFQFLESLVFVSPESNDDGYFDIHTYLSMSEDHLNVQPYKEKLLLSYMVMNATSDAIMMLKFEAHENEMEEQEYPKNSLPYLDTYLLHEVHHWMLGSFQHVPLQNSKSFNQAFLFAMKQVRKTIFQDPTFQKKYGISSWDDYLKLHLIHPHDLESPPKLKKSKPRKKDTIH